MPLDYIEFSKKIKQKYPQYKDVDDMVLAKKMVEKYPEYRSQVEFQELKKKRSTELPSPPKGKDTTSDIVKKTTQKPSVSSGGQGNREMFTGFPGKENKKYVLDKSSGIPVWKEYSSSEVVNGKTVDKFEKIISDPARVDGLNKQFNKKASTSNTEKIRTGLPTKEDNQYRVRNGKWQRLTSNSTQWEDINNEKAVGYLNKYYGETVKAPLKTDKKPEQKINTSIINTQLVSKTEEEVVPKLQSEYGKYGFTFDQIGMGTDYVKVRSKNGNTIEISLDEKNPEEALKLRSFLESNKSYQTEAGKKIERLSNYLFNPNLDANQEKNAAKRWSEYKKSNEYVNDLKSLSYEELEDQINKNKEEFDNRLFGALPKEKIKIQKEIDDYYNSDAYKVYKQRRKENANVKSDEIDNLYYELKQAKSPEEKKKVKVKIDSYLSKKIIDKQSDNYNLQLGDVSKSYKKLNAAVSQLDKDKIVLDERIKSGNISQEEYEALAEKINIRAEYLDGRRQEIKSERDKVFSDMKKLETITGKYLINKEKSGSIPGNMLNSFVSGLDQVFRQTPLASGIQKGESLLHDRYETLSPEEKDILKGKGYNKQEIEQYIINKNTLSRIEDLKTKSIETFGTTGTTQEYMKSKDRGFFEKSISGVFQSLPGMIMPGGAMNRISALSAQAYSSIEEEMLNDKDFETTSAEERAAIAIPYSIGMGLLENLGFTSAMSNNPLVKSLLKQSLLSSIKKIGGDASREAIENVINKEIKSNIAKFGIRIVGGTLAEAETGALQSATLDIGLKKLYNEWRDGNDGKTANSLTEGEYFSTPNTFMEGLSQVTEDAAAEAIGGLVMTTFGTSVQAIMNEGKISLYNDKDVEFLKTLSTDPEIKKIFVAKLKTNMLNGSMTKSEAEAQLNALNEIESTFNKIPENITSDNLKTSVGLIAERNKLEQEIAGKDENLVAAQKARIADINNQLKTISENATKKSTEQQQEVTAEGGVVQREGVDEGQPEVGQGEGTVGQATQQGADLGDRPVEGRGEAQVTARQAINRPAILTAFGGTTFDSPLQGDTYVEGQQVIFEDRSTGRVYELGNVDEVMDSTIPGLQVQEETISVTPEGKVSIDGNNWNIQSELPTQGVEYNPDGTVMRVSLKDDNGNTQMFDGQQAVDIAYQIELQKMQTAEQQQFINDLLEQDEEFQAATESIKPTEVEAVIEEETAPDTVQAEPTAEPATEPTTVEQPAVESEVEQLGKLLSGTDQQIEEEASKISNKRMSKIVSNAARALSKIAPNVKFVIHDNDDSYRKATGEENRSQSSNGEYNPKTKTVHINLTKANARTVAHEVFHAILLDRVSSDAQANAVTKRMIEAIANKIEGDPELKKYLEDFAANYKENIQNEEKLAELVGKLAENYMNSPQTIKDIIKRWLNKLAGMFSTKPITTEQEVMEVLNTIARKVATGKKIRERQVSGLIGEKADVVADMNKRFQADFSDAVSKLTFVFDKNTNKFKKLEEDGFITKDKSLSDFDGKYIFLHQPDAAFSGAIYKDGELLIEGKGGVFYPIKFHEDGYFWASTDSTAENMAKDLNKVMDQNGGTIYMALTSAPSDKLMSSTTMANAVLDFFSSKAFDKNFKITPLQLKTALRRAANDVKIKKSKNKKTGKITEKPFGLDLKLPAKATLEEIQSAIKTALGTNNSSFEDRKNFALELTKLMANEINKNDVAVNQFGKLFSQGIQNKYFKGITKTGKLKISAANMTQALSEMFTEPMLKEGVDRDKGGQVYAILELNGPVKPTKSDKHESYPMAIQSDSDNKVKLHILNDRQNWYDVFEDFETNDIVTEDRRLNIYPTSGVSVRGLRLNLSKTKEGTQQRKQLSDLLDRKQDRNPSSIVSVARKNGFSEAAIEEYLRRQGFTDQQIQSAMSINDNINVNEIFDRSKKALQEKQSSRSITKAIRFVWNKFIDRQSDIKRLITGIGTKPSQKAFNMLVTRAGAKGWANYRYKEAEGKIYKGLKEKDIDTLDKLIYVRRIISINENRLKLREEAYKGLNDKLSKELDNIISAKKKNSKSELNAIEERLGSKIYKDLIKRSEKYKEPYKGIEGYSEAEARRDLQDMENTLGEKKFKDLSKRADAYFDVFAKSLENLYKSGRITEEVYNNLKDVEYSPIATIKYIIGDNLSLDEIDRQAEIYGITRKDIATLTDKNENEIIMDSQWLLMMNLMSVEARAWENRMLNSFADAVNSATDEQKVALSEYVRVAKSGDIVPAGFVTINYSKDGKDQRLFVKAEYATQLLDVKTRQSGLEALGKLSGTQILRFFATGGNPLFIVGNTAVDFANILFFSNVYGNFKTIGGIKLTLDFVSNFMKKLFATKKYKSTLKEFMEHGGGMDFMSSDGLRALKKLRPTYRVTNAAQKTLVAYGNAMSYLGETSELAFRLSAYSKVKDNLIKEYKKNNDGNEPTGQALEDIMFQAARESRETVDFSQGGSWAKPIDLVMPYFNAALQGFRRPFEFAKKNPVGFAWALTEAAMMSGGMAAMSLASLALAVGGDDEEEKKKKMIDALNSISEHEKAMYHIIFTGKVDEDGEYEYVRIKKLPFLSMVTTLAEQMVYAKLLSTKEKEYSIDSKVVKSTIEKSVPLMPNEIAGRNPLVSALLAYNNYDTFTKKKVFREPRDGKIAPEAEGMFDDKVENFYKTFAPKLGMSPVRTKAFVEKIVTTENTNPTIALFNATLNGLFGKDTSLFEEFKGAMGRVAEAAGKKLVRKTNKDIIMYNEMDKAKSDEILLRTDKYLKEQQTYSDIKKVYEKGEKMTNGELITLIKDRFDQRDVKNYVEKYYTYIQNMDADKSVLDILYEQNAEIQALKIYNKYGRTLDGEDRQEIMESVRTSRKRISPKAMMIYREKYQRGN
jgi:hypothetical protein